LTTTAIFDRRSRGGAPSSSCGSHSGDAVQRRAMWEPSAQGASARKCSAITFAGESMPYRREHHNFRRARPADREVVCVAFIAPRTPVWVPLRVAATRTIKRRRGKPTSAAFLSAAPSSSSRLARIPLPSIRLRGRYSFFIPVNWVEVLTEAAAGAWRTTRLQTGLAFQGPAGTNSRPAPYVSLLPGR